LGSASVTEPALPAAFAEPPAPLPGLLLFLLEQAARITDPPATAAPYRNDLRDR
jgi:hypothetical protein